MKPAEEVAREWLPDSPQAMVDVWAEVIEQARREGAESMREHIIAARIFLTINDSENADRHLKEALLKLPLTEGE